MADAKRDGHQGDVWLQTKMEGCGNALDPGWMADGVRIARGSCKEDTKTVFRSSLRELNVDRVDSTLLHSPPCVAGASWVQGCVGPGDVYPNRCDCKAAEPCRMMRQQWRALEEVYAEGLTRSIGVSNYCQACLQVGVAWLGLAWLGLAWLGLALLGLAWLASLCLAWLGLAWLGLLCCAC